VGHGEYVQAMTWVGCSGLCCHARLLQGPHRSCSVRRPSHADVTCFAVSCNKRADVRTQRVPSARGIPEGERACQLKSKVA